MNKKVTKFSPEIRSAGHRKRRLARPVLILITRVIRISFNGMPLLISLGLRRIRVDGWEALRLGERKQADQRKNPLSRAG